MPGVMSSRSEFKWGQYNEGHDMLSAIPVVQRYEQHTVRVARPTLGITGLIRRMQSTSDK